MELERAKEERRREMEMMRRQQQMAKEEEMRRKKLAQSQQRRARYSPGRIVLGPDGNLYRIVSPAADDEQLRRGEERFPAGGKQRFGTKQRFSSSDESKENYSDEQMIPAEERDSFHDESGGSSESEGSSVDDVCESHTHEDHFYDAVDVQTVPVSHEVEVEDVPDEEDDELRELHSIRRNRSPSPGQWMEPVEC